MGNLQRRWSHRSRSRDPSLVAGQLCASSTAQAPIRSVNGEEVRPHSLAFKVRSQVADLVRWNQELSAKLQDQVQQLERLRRLRRFLSPQVADAIIADKNETELSSHRREIAAMFCDLRGFTAFSDSASPDAVLDVLRTYHAALGKLIDTHGGTIEHRAGDGIMVIFNAPKPCRDPALAGLRLAVEMRGRMHQLTQKWRKCGYELGFGVGMSLGYATVGMIGSEERFDYVANGRVVNLASRLSDEAADGQILLSERAYDAVRDYVVTESVGELTLKGFRQQVRAFNVLSLNERPGSGGRADGNEAHADDDQKCSGKLDWGQWLPEEEIGHY